MLKDVQGTTNVFKVTKALEGYRRLRSTFDARIPITNDTLLKMSIYYLASVCFSPYKACLFHA